MQESESYKWFWFPYGIDSIQSKINLLRQKSVPQWKSAVKRLLLTGQFPPNKPTKCYTCFRNLGLVLTAIITSTFIRIVTGKLRMFRIVAVVAKTIFSTWYSCFQTISFMGQITTKDPASDSVMFMVIDSKFSLQHFLRRNQTFFSEKNALQNRNVRNKQVQKQWTPPKF